jgi:phage tail sheath gpL-like
MSLDNIQFNYIPGSGLVAPIFTAEFNSGGQYTSVDCFVLIGHKVSSGTMAFNTLTPVSAQQQVDAYCGKNSQLREMARIAFANAPALPLWIMAIDDSALTANVRTITIGSAALVAGVGLFQIMGETLQISVSSTDTTTTVAASVAAAINSYYNPLTGAQLPFSATSASAVVTLTAFNKGAMFNEIDIYVPTNTNNVLAASGAWTVATTTAGAGTPTGVAAALAALGDNPADFVICPWSDATSLSSYTAWSNDVSGRWAWSRQSYGHVWSASVNNFAGLTNLGVELNDRHLSILGCYTPGSMGTPHPSYLWITAFAARLFPWLTDVSTGNISRAHSGLQVQGISPPRDPSVWPNYNGRNVLNNSGISTWSVAHDGTVRISKIITTYQTGVSGNPDAVFRDIQAMYQCSEGMKYIRAELAQLLGQKAIVSSNPGSLAAAVTVLDIKAAFVAIYNELCDTLVFQDVDTFASLIQVAINANNPNRVDVFMPMERVNPLDILAINATIYQQFPNTSLLPAGTLALPQAP